MRPRAMKSRRSPATREAPRSPPSRAPAAPPTARLEPRARPGELCPTLRPKSRRPRARPTRARKAKMKVNVQTLDARKGGDLELKDDIFGVEPRADILHRVVTWQLTNRRAPARAARERSDVARTGKKY